MQDKANEKLIEYEGMDEDGEMVETQILTQVIGKEQHGQLRGHGLGPMRTSYYEYSSHRNTTTSSSHYEYDHHYHQMEQRVQQMEKEHEREHAQYKALFIFL